MAMKGQAFSLELLFYVLSIMVLVSMFYQVTATRTNIIKQQYSEFKKQFLMFEATQSLIMTAGTTPETIGLAKNDKDHVYRYELSNNKINQLISRNINEVKKILKLEDYEVYIEINNKPIGKPIQGTTIKRMALCGSEMCEVKITAK